MKKKFSKHFLLLLFALLFVPPKIMADEAYEAIKVEEQDGRVLFYKLANHPKASFKDDGIHLKADDIEVIYPNSGTLTVTFVSSDESNAIDDTVLDGAVFNVSNEAIEGSNLTPEKPVFVYDLNGILVASTSTDAEGSFFISLANLSQGLYIFNSDNTSFKFYKK